ncbi:MAG: DUF952 domain-containing protein [Sphingomonadaceae bacterium]
MSSPILTTAFKILTADQWASWQAAGIFTGAPVDLADGFIHLSAADQVAETAARHFAGKSDLILAEIDLSALGEAVKWEPSRGGALFPHVYASVPLSAVRSSSPMNGGDYNPAKSS